MNNSRQRNLILNIINESYNHPTAYEIYEIAKEEVPNISLGTVYRNLKLLYEHNMIIKITTNDKVTHYDKVFDKHSHFICDVCNGIYDVSCGEDIPKEILGNKVLGCDIRYNGICHVCLKKEEEKWN